MLRGAEKQQAAKSDGAAIDPQTAAIPQKNLQVIDEAIAQSREALREGALGFKCFLIESGVPDFEVSSWVGILAPAKTPRPIVERLNRELNAALSNPEVVEKLAGMGIAATPGSPDQFTEQMRSDLAKYGQVIKAAGIKAE